MLLRAPHSKISIIWLDFFVKKGGLDINRPSSTGEYLLCLAVKCHHARLVRLLIEHRAHLDVKGPDGKTPLQLALASSHQEIIRSIISAIREYGAVESRGWTPSF